MSYKIFAFWRLYVNDSVSLGTLLVDFRGIVATAVRIPFISPIFYTCDRLASESHHE